MIWDFEPPPFRLVTQAERDAHEDREAARYDRIYAEIEAEEREEHDREFPGDPYKPDGRYIHRKTEERLRAEDRDL